MVTTNHRDHTDRIRLMRLHGINRDAYNRPSWYYEVVEAGFKYNMDIDIAGSPQESFQLHETNGFGREEIALPL